MNETISIPERLPHRVARKRRRLPIGSISRHVVLLAFTGLALLPIYFMLVNAFKTNSEFVVNDAGPPHHPVLSRFHTVFSDGSMGRWMLNSLFISLSSVALATALAALAAYPLSLMRWRPSRLITSLMIALIVIPPIVLIIPLFQMMADAHQLNTYRGVIAIYTGMMLPFSTFLLVSFFSTIPRTLLEAARMDGAKTWRTFTRIVLPVSMPAITTVFIVEMLWVWNEVLIAIVFLQKDSLRTLMVGLTHFQTRFEINVPVIMAGMVIATLPLLVLYLAGQRFFIRGLTSGGTKG
jgi:ABC-type glycerol-3-phosphate transport system permease component